MSAMEPQSLQYMSFHTSRLQMSSEELETIRLRLAHESPLQEALDICLRCLDSTLVIPVVQHLCEHLHRGIGLATRVSAAQSLSTLAETYPTEMSSSKSIGKAFEIIIQSLVSIPSGTSMQSSLPRALFSVLGSLSKVIQYFLWYGLRLCVMTLLCVIGC